MKAIWQNTAIAESDDTVMLEGNYYFPRSSLRDEFISGSKTKTSCPWKGIAHYYSVNVDGHCNKDAVWFYPEPKPAAQQIEERVAFWRGIEIRD